MDKKQMKSSLEEITDVLTNLHGKISSVVGNIDNTFYNTNFSNELDTALGKDLEADNQAELPIEKEHEKLHAVTNCPYLEDKCSDLECPCPKYTAYKMMQQPNIIEEKIAQIGVDPKADSWTVMMGMQKVFAGRFHNTENMTKEEKDHWIKEYLICIEDEIGEMMDHVTLPLGIKIVHRNDEEFRKEVIDILHFVMDVFIAGEASAEDIKQAYLKNCQLEVTDVKNFIKFAFDLQIYQDVYDEKIRMKERNNFIDYNIRVLDLAMRILRAGRKVRQQISWKHWKKPNDSINDEKLHEAYAQLFAAFIDLAILTFDDEEQMKDIYIKKNVENILRQELGY